MNQTSSDIPELPERQEQGATHQTMHQIAHQLLAFADRLYALAARMQLSRDNDALPQVVQKLALLRSLMQEIESLIHGDEGESGAQEQKRTETRDTSMLAHRLEDMADAIVRTSDSRLCVVTAVNQERGVDVRPAYPHMATWLAKHRLRVLTLQHLVVEEERRQMHLARILETSLRLSTNGASRAVIAWTLLDIIRRALNRRPSLIARAEAYRQRQGISIEDAAAALEMSVEEYDRWIVQGNKITPRQRVLLREWIKDAEALAGGKAFHAGKRLEEIADDAGLTVQETEAVLRGIIAAWTPLQTEQFIDAIQITPRGKTVHVWVPSDIVVERFFAGGWLQLAIKHMVQRLLPDAEIITNVRMAQDTTVFSVSLLAVLPSQAALVIEPMTASHADQQQRRFARWQHIARMLETGADTHLIVVRAVADDAALQRTTASFSLPSDTPGFSITTLDEAAETITSAFHVLLQKTDTEPDNRSGSVSE